MNYHNITMDDMLNGDGLRVVLWVSGCDNHCKGCQNPQTWDANSGIPFDENAKAELFDDLSRDYISGITFSGGDPLYAGNVRPVGELVREIRAKFPNKTIWLYTGRTFETLSDVPFLREIDVLVDGPYVEALRDTQLKWKGSANQRVIDVKRTFEIGRIVLWADGAEALPDVGKEVCCDCK